jgi:hypothetical protein
MPAVVSANRIQDIPLGPKHTMRLFDNIESDGAIQYAFLLMVVDNATEEPVYFVSSEVNAMAAVYHDGSHYLCIFSEAGHGNLDGSDNWGDPEKFFPQAIVLAAEHVGVSPEEVANQERGESAPRPLLMEAVRKGDIGGVRTLLAKGVEVDEKVRDGITALMFASSLGHTEIVKVLLNAGAEVNAATEFGVTPLMWAAAEGCAETVKVLLAKGAKMNAKGRGGVTALMLATEKGHTEIVQLLKQAGARSV